MNNDGDIEDEEEIDKGWVQYLNNLVQYLTTRKFRLGFRTRIMD